ncbi:hypothetical protein PXH59_16030 [Xenorhabdus sp. SF857]|uniref:hypothetical protein n=1 Tax=Xenorhabdus bakwenae TaxID=3026967 RepID=UPI002557E30D|nr:hypothetical protein [Xenorhabdus sp. SF857]WFQ79104.1 hypothetical protein PXH59_16030 [Xenorhabdus sp. SF857]
MKKPEDLCDLPAVLSLSRLIIPKQFPHPELNLTELILLALVLLLDVAGVVAVRNEHQTAVQYLHGQGTNGRAAGVV